MSDLSLSSDDARYAEESISDGKYTYALQPYPRELRVDEEWVARSDLSDECGQLEEKEFLTREEQERYDQLREALRVRNHNLRATVTLDEEPREEVTFSSVTPDFRKRVIEELGRSPLFYVHVSGAKDIPGEVVFPDTKHFRGVFIHRDDKLSETENYTRRNGEIRVKVDGFSGMGVLSEPSVVSTHNYGAGETAQDTIVGTLYDNKDLILVADDTDPPYDMFDFGFSESHFYEEGEDVEHIEIGDNITGIGQNAFRNIYSMETLDIGGDVTEIRTSAFRNCTSLAELTIGNSVETIGNGAFHTCTSLLEVTIPDSVKTLVLNAFRNCTSLAELTIGNSVEAIEGSAFRDCTSLATIYNHYDGNQAHGGLVWSNAGDDVPVGDRKAYCYSANTNFITAIEDEDFTVSHDFPVDTVDVTIFPPTATATASAPAPTIVATTAQHVTVLAVTATAESAAISPTIEALKSAYVTGIPPPDAEAEALAPTVATSQNVSVESPIATATAQGLAPEISTTASVSIETPTATAESEALAPIATATKSATIEAPTAQATARAEVPTANATKSVTIEPPAATATAEAHLPTVYLTRNITIEAPNATADAEAPAPTATATKNVSVSVVAATASAEGKSPSITTTREVSVPAPTATATAEGKAPTVTTAANVSVTAPVGEANAEAPAPTIETTKNVSVSIPVATAQAEGKAPTVYLARSIAIEAPTATATAAGKVPGVLTGSVVRILPPTATATAQAPIPRIAAIDMTPRKRRIQLSIATSVKPWKLRQRNPHPFRR